MRFKYRVAHNWPALAWLASIDLSGNVVGVVHGPKIETREDWFCEAIWGGDFEDGDFDCTDQIFGSGARIRNGKLTFVTSGTTVDRLQSIQIHDTIYVSNSLPCLLNQVDGRLDPTFARYQQLFGTILLGIDDYERELATSAGKVRLTYFHNLTLNGKTLEEIDKPETVSGFKCFQDYRAYLGGAIKELVNNLSSPQRSHPFRLLGTISSGYDSPAITTLACEAGLKEVISFTHSKTGKKDTGEEAAKVLGVKLTLVDRDGWRKCDLPEAAFVSSDAKGEDCYFRGAQDLLAGCAVLTGFQAGQSWQKRPVIHGRTIQRKDRSGLSLTEYRLRAGFIHAAVAYMALRHVDDLARISQSPEMSPLGHAQRLQQADRAANRRDRRCAARSIRHGEESGVGSVQHRARYAVSIHAGGFREMAERSCRRFLEKWQGSTRSTRCGARALPVVRTPRVVRLWANEIGAQVASFRSRHIARYRRMGRKRTAELVPVSVGDRTRQISLRRRDAGRS
jgi:hypothetical protein